MEKEIDGITTLRFSPAKPNTPRAEAATKKLAASETPSPPCSGAMGEGTHG